MHSGFVCTILTLMSHSRSHSHPLSRSRALSLSLFLSLSLYGSNILSEYLLLRQRLRLCMLALNVLPLPSSQSMQV